LSWTAGDPAAPEAHRLDFSVPTATLGAPPPVIVARIINKRTAAFPPGALGWSLPAAQAGAHVTTFLDEIKRRQAEVGVSVPCLLGYALAHETWARFDGFKRSCAARPDASRMGQGRVRSHPTRRFEIQ